MPNIAYVEQDRLASINYVEPSASWGLARISQRILPLSRNHTFPDKAGQGVRVYVIDTGINIDHPEFQGRADFGVSFTDDGDADGNGHGTHCAGTIASKSVIKLYQIYFI